jgi:RNA recognition motif-containing protein
VKLAQDERERQDPEEARKKTLDLVEKASGERKYLKDGSREFANTVLGEKRTYIFVEMKKNPEDEAADEEPVNIQINGKACRTPDEDIKWDEEQANAEANAPAKGKAPPKGKKK